MIGVHQSHTRNLQKHNLPMDCFVLFLAQMRCVVALLLKKQVTNTITFLNKAGMTLSCRGSKKIHAPNT